MTLNTRNKAYRLEIGGANDGAVAGRGRPQLYLVHANDQEMDDDFEGQRNWTFMIVLFSAAVASLTSWAAIIALF